MNSLRPTDLHRVAPVPLGEAAPSYITTTIPPLPKDVVYTAPLTSKPQKGLWQRALNCAGALGIGAAVALGSGCTTTPMHTGASATESVKVGAFTILPPEKSVERIASSYKATNDIDIRTQISGKQLSANEVASISQVSNALRPLWQCKNARQVEVARVDRLVRDDVVSSGTAGVAFATFGLIGIADSSSRPGGSFATVGVFTHELAHMFLQYANPITCTNYSRADSNPLMQEYRAIGEADGGRRVSGYGNTSWLEDMAEAFRLYMSEREQLQRDFPERAAFFDSVFTRMKVTPPPQVSERKPAV